MMQCTQSSEQWTKNVFIYFVSQIVSNEMHSNGFLVENQKVQNSVAVFEFAFSKCVTKFVPWVF